MMKISELVPYLKDIAIIDYRTRLILFKMIIDIEHYLKIRILKFMIVLEKKLVTIIIKKSFVNMI